MFCCSSDDPEDKANNKLIEDSLKEEARRDASEVKLLLLGAGESGKSTIFKQMKIIHDKGYTREDLLRYRDVIHANVLTSIRDMILAMGQHGLSFSNIANVEVADKYAGLNEQGIAAEASKFSPATAKDVKSLWSDEGVREVYKRRSTFQLIDSASYFLNDIDRVGAVGYMPSEQDVLRCRVKTVGIVETLYNIDGHNFRVVDVGGQRNERRKWLHVFDSVTAMIFVTSMSEYDQLCFEDNMTNRMTESLNLWEQMLSSPHFQRTSLILFLNKMDLFSVKIQSVDLSVCWTDYRGGCNLEEAKRYILHKFVSMNKSTERKVYPHFTTATDTDNMRKILNDVKNIVLMGNLREADMI